MSACEGDVDATYGVTSASVLCREVLTTQWVGTS